MAIPGIDAAASRYLEDVAEDILGLLGPGIELDELALDTNESAAVALRARYRLAGIVATSVGRGENVVEAHSRLREAIVEDRVGLGLRILVEAPSGSAITPGG